MSQQSEKKILIAQELREAILREIESSKQMIVELRDEELEEIAGAGGRGPVIAVGGPGMPLTFVSPHYHLPTGSQAPAHLPTGSQAPAHLPTGYPAGPGKIVGPDGKVHDLKPWMLRR